MEDEFESGNQIQVSSVVSTIQIFLYQFPYELMLMYAEESDFLTL